MDFKKLSAVLKAYELLLSEILPVVEELPLNVFPIPFAPAPTGTLYESTL